jgi:LacI family transcriptional regulator
MFLAYFCALKGFFMSRRVSQSQIAKELGVSQSLVSLVLNGRREGVAEESYKLIWETAVKQGYVPRGMQPEHAPDVQHSYVGVVTRAGQNLAAQNNTFLHVRQGLFSALQNANISLAFLGAEGDLDEKKLLELLGRRDPLLGIVVLGEVSADFMRALGELKLPLVGVYASHPGLCSSIIPNDEESIEQLVDHLVGLGHTRFAWIGGNARLKSNPTRFAALRNRLAVREIDFDDCCAVSAERAGRQDGFDCAEKLIARTRGKDLPTAWICHNGLIARGALQFAYMHGLKVPADLSIAAIDNTRACTEIHPCLTSAASDPERVGEEAARLLLDQRNKENGRQGTLADLVVPSCFHAGETSAPCPDS